MQTTEDSAGILQRDRLARRIADVLREAKALRRVASYLSLRQERATVLQSAIELEQLAAALEGSMEQDCSLEEEVEQIN